MYTHESLMLVKSVLACGDSYDQMLLKISLILASQLVTSCFQCS